MVIQAERHSEDPSWYLVGDGDVELPFVRLESLPEVLNEASGECSLWLSSAVHPYEELIASVLPLPDHVAMNQLKGFNLLSGGPLVEFHHEP